MGVRPRAGMVPDGVGWFAALSLAPLVLLVAIALADDPSVIAIAMRDQAATGRLNPATGAMSSLGAFMWFAAALVCAFAARVPQAAEERETRAFLNWSAGLSLYFWLDDFFMLHEYAAPLLGVPEMLVMALLGLWVCAYAVRFRRRIAAGGHALLLAAIGLLGLSELSDVALARLVGGTNPWEILIEDGLKWLGICAWTGFHIGNCRRLVARGEA